MTKICFITTVSITLKSFLLDFAEYLHGTGRYEITFVCNPDDEFAAMLPSYVVFEPIEMRRGIDIKGIAAVGELTALFRKERFDIVQYSTPNAAFYASIAAKRAQVPVRLYCQWGIRYMGLSGLPRAIFRRIEKTVCSNSTAIEAESENIREFAISEGLYEVDKCVVVWNGSACGVNLFKFDIGKREEWRRDVRNNYGFGPDDVVFAFAGRLTADKGVNELLGAFLGLSEDDPHVRLLVMGSMDNYGSLDSGLFDRARHSAAVVFAGQVSDMERHYAAADVFVAPSYREGFGLVVVEAEAMGLPALVSNVPGQIDAIDPGVTGLAFEVKSTESLRLAMGRLASNRNLRERMGEAAASYAAEHYEQTELFRRLELMRTGYVENERGGRYE